MMRRPELPKKIRVDSGLRVIFVHPGPPNPPRSPNPPRKSVRKHYQSAGSDERFLRCQWRDYGDEPAAVS
jgi:hypothetical protein